MPAPPVLQNYITRTDELLAELHQVMTTRTAIRGRHSYTGHDPRAAPNRKFDPAVTPA